MYFLPTMEDHLKKLDFFPMLTGITPKDMDELVAFPAVMGKVLLVGFFFQYHSF